MRIFCYSIIYSLIKKTNIRKKIDISLIISKSMELKKGYSRKLDNRFSIHIAGNTEEELNAILKFNNQLHNGEEIIDYIQSFLLKYPRKNEIYWLYIKDNKTGNIVSSLCLSPMEWQFENIELPVCEMEFVGTLEAYRERGFIKTLNNLYEEIMERNDYLLSGIRGIPSFYRGLGYVYISSLDERLSISAFKIHNKDDSIKIRKAKSDDIRFIESKYSEFHKKFSLFCKFNEECFTFKYLNDEFTTEVRSTYILEEGGVAKNYFSLGWTYDKKYYEIICPDLNNREMTVLLEYVKKLGNYHDNDEIIISVNKHTSLFKYIISLGGKPVSEYGWQIKIPNLKKYFSFTKRVIESKLKNTDFKELTQSIMISNYKETIKLEFNKGKVKQIERIVEHPDLELTDLRIHGAFLYKFILGDRSIDEINFIMKDAILNLSSRTLIETIFPKSLSLLGSYI